MNFKELLNSINEKCRIFENEDKQVISDEKAFEAYALVNVIKLVKEGDFLRYLAALNLLNAYVKQEGAKLTYHFKKYLDNLFNVSVDNKVDFLKYNKLKDDSGEFILVAIDNVQFSFHSVKLDIEGLDYLLDENLIWDGLKKQKIALSIFDMSMESEILTTNKTIFNGDLNYKLTSIMEWYNEGYLTFEDDLRDLDMDEIEYDIFKKRYDRFSKYGLPVNFFDRERQVREYVYNEPFVDYFTGNVNHEVVVRENLIEPLSDLAVVGFYYSFNTLINNPDNPDELIVGHSHQHDFDAVVQELYMYPESFSIDSEDEYLYSKQELNYLNKVKKYLLFMGLKDCTDFNDKSRYCNDTLNKYKDAVLLEKDDEHIESIFNNKFIVVSADNSVLDFYKNRKFIVRNLDGDFKLYLVTKDCEKLTYKDIKDKYYINDYKDDNEVYVFNIDILEKY